MGNWNINIQGVGCHNNGKPEVDADLAATDFVAKLRSQGHQIESATFTHGSSMDLEAERAQPAGDAETSGALVAGIMKCERCGKECRCPYCNKF